MTIHEIKLFAKLYIPVSLLIRKIASEIMDYRHGGLDKLVSPAYQSYHSHICDSETVTVNFEEYDTSFNSVTFPLSYLWTEDYMALEEVAYAKQKQAEHDAEEALNWLHRNGQKPQSGHYTKI